MKTKNKIQIELDDGTILYVSVFDNDKFTEIQSKTSKVIVKIDGTPACYWGMTQSEINAENTRIKVLREKRKTRMDAIKLIQINCKHDKGGITNIEREGTQCVICGWAMF